MNSLNLDNQSYRKLRRLIGYMGIALPVLLFLYSQLFDHEKVFGEVEPSISDYYYTEMSTIFTGILISYGLILFTYAGKCEQESEAGREDEPRVGNKVLGKVVLPAGGKRWNTLLVF